LDFSKRLIKIAERNNSPVVVGDALSIPFSDGVFDKVYSFEVMQYVPPRSISAFVAEGLRLVKPDGTLCILGIPDKRSVFGYYHSFGQKIWYALHLLFKGGLFSSQIGYWHKVEDFQKVASTFNLDLVVVCNATY
jgi:ubiquinone/menaquinone biosynthesis C-methylase UbiE